MKALKVEPGKRPVVIDIENTLEVLQKQVGGYIQVIEPYKDGAAIVCDEEGKYKWLEPNRVLFDKEGRIMDLIVGTFLIVGCGEDDFVDLSDDLIEKYKELFWLIETFVDAGERLFMIDEEDGYYEL